MLNTLKRNDVGTAIVLVVMSFIMRLKYILHPPKLEIIDGFHQGFLFQWKGLFNFYTAHPSLYVGLSAIVSIAFAVYFNFFINREKIFTRKSFIPAFAFLLYSSFLPTLAIFSTVFIANAFLFIAFANVLNSYHSTSPQKTFFNTGLCVGLATLFYFPAIILFILFIILILIVRPLKLQEIFAYVFGVITPFYFVGILLFLAGKWKPYVQHLNYHIHLPLKTISTPIFISLTVISILMLFYGFFLVNQSQSRNTTGVRKKWTCIGFYVFFSMIAAMFSNSFPSLTWLIFATPFSIVLAQSLQNNKEKMNTFTFYFLLIMLFTIQWWMQTKFI